MSRTLKKILHAPVEDRAGDPSIYSLALYHVAIKAGLYRKAVQVYYIPNYTLWHSPPPNWIRPRILRSIRITGNET